MSSTQAHSSLSATQPSRPTLSGKTVLIADDDPTLVRLLAVKCGALGLRVETAGDGLRTLLKVTRDKPDLLILDLTLPDVDGFRVVERLTDPKFPPLPVIVLTGRSDEAAIRRCDELGVLYVHKDGWDELEKAIYRVFSPNGMQGFWLTLRTQPNLVVTDYNMDQGSGHYLLSRIKSTPSVQHIPVIVFTGQSLDKGAQHSIRRDLRGRGQAAAFLSKPIDTSTLLAEIGRHVPLRGKA